MDQENYNGGTMDNTGGQQPAAEEPTVVHGTPPPPPPPGYTPPPPPVYPDGQSQSYPPGGVPYGAPTQADYGAPAQPYDPSAGQGYGAPAQPYDPSAGQGYGAPAQPYDPSAGQGYGAPGQPYDPYAAQGAVPADGGKPPKGPKKPLNKKLLIAIGAGALVIVAAVVLAFVFLRGGNSGAAEPYNNPHYVFFDSNDKVGVIKEDGSFIETGVAATRAQVNADASRLVYLDEDKNLYIMDLSNMNTTELDVNVSEMMVVLDTYVVYSKSEQDLVVEDILEEAAEESGVPLEWVEELFDDMSEDGSLEDALQVYEMYTGDPYPLDPESYYIATLKDMQPDLLFDADEAKDRYSFVYATSGYNNQMAYISSDGDVMLLDKKGNKTNVGSVPSKRVVQIQGVPDAGQMVVWSARDGNKEQSVYAYVGGSDEKLASFDSGYSTLVQVFYTKKDDAAIVYPWGSTELYEISSSGMAEKIRVDGSTIQSVSFPEPLWKKQTNLDGFFVTTAESRDDTATLYYINASREREKISSDVRFEYVVSSVEAAGSKVFYIDEDDNLRVCELKSGGVNETEKIASDVSSYKISMDGSVVWYMKGDDLEKTIYRFENGEATKIDTNSGGLIISPDGKSAVYIKNIEEFEGTYGSVGQMYLYHNGESTRLGNDVVNGRMYTQYKGSYVDPAALLYMGNCSYDDKTGLTVGDIYFYNGKEATKVMRNVQTRIY